jgi:exonuclease SbcD
MLILHTADIHLRNLDDERWQALVTLLGVAHGRGADLLVISGDIFDKNIAAEELRAELRTIFNKYSLRVILLPGNHDGSALAAGQYYGDNVDVLSEAGSYADLDAVRVIALPFASISSEKVMEKLLALRGKIRDGASNILLFHGELLDLAFWRGGYGDEEDTGYMPVKLAFFDDLGFDYVLAGHFHSNFEIGSYSGGYFVYPGSPVAVSKKEKGVRKVNLFRVGQVPEALALETFHYEDKEITLNPFDESDPFDEMKKALRGCDEKAEITLSISGYVDLGKLKCTENEFTEEIERIRTPQVLIINHYWKNAEAVFENELYMRFEKRLRESNLGEDLKDRMRRMVIEAVMEVTSAH